MGKPESPARLRVCPPFSSCSRAGAEGLRGGRDPKRGFGQAEKERSQGVPEEREGARGGAESPGKGRQGGEGPKRTETMTVTVEATGRSGPPGPGVPKGLSKKH